MTGENVKEPAMPVTWSLGCLFFELLTGQFLFADNDWVRFFIRVTSTVGELIPAEKRAMVNNNPVILNFLSSVLVRKANVRPSLDSVIARFQTTKAQLLSSTKKSHATLAIDRFGPNRRSKS